MTSIGITIMFWETRAKKLSSYIDWRLVWRKPCIYFRAWLRRSNMKVNLSNPPPTPPWKKMKSLPAYQTNKR